MDIEKQKERKSFEIDFVLNIDTSKKFLCCSCGNLVIPDHALKAACGELICGDCAPDITHCTEHLSHQFEKSIVGLSLKKEIGEVVIHCVWWKKGCPWIGTCSDHAAHYALCPWTWSIEDSQHVGEVTNDLTITTEVMAKKYENALFLWSWQGETVDEEPVLSDIRVQSRGMCAIVSITAAFEASLRLKGHKVKLLSMDDLFQDYLKSIHGPNGLRGSKLKVLAMVLKEKGMVVLSSDNVSTKRWHISNFKMFDMKTKDGMLEALNHIRDNGPIVCVHAVNEYQSDNLQSWGIIHGIPSIYNVPNHLSEHNISSLDLRTHAVCSVGFGSEDITSFLHYQNTAGVDVQKDGYGRMLPCSALEALGLFVGEDCCRPLKRSSVMVGQQDQRRHKHVRCNTEAPHIDSRPR